MGEELLSQAQGLLEEKANSRESLVQNVAREGAPHVLSIEVRSSLPSSSATTLRSCVDGKFQPNRIKNSQKIEKARIAL